MGTAGRPLSSAVLWARSAFQGDTPVLEAFAFFILDLGISLGVLAIIIQFLPKVYVFNDSRRVGIEVFTSPVSDSSC